MNLGITTNPSDILVGTAIIAIVEFIKKYVPQVNGSVTILVTAILGGLAGLIGIDGLNVQTGIAVGLAASGSHQLFMASSGR